MSDTTGSSRGTSRSSSRSRASSSRSSSPSSAASLSSISSVSSKDSVILVGGNKKQKYSYKKNLKFMLRFQHNIKLYHWNTHKYSAHIASDQLYDNVLPLIDRFVELYISKFGRPSDTLSKLKGLTIKFTFFNDRTFSKYLDKCNEYLNGMKKTSLEKQSDLMNVVDDMLVAVNQAKFLCSFS